MPILFKMLGVENEYFIILKNGISFNLNGNWINR